MFDMYCSWLMIFLFLSVSLIYLVECSRPVGIKELIHTTLRLTYAVPTFDLNITELEEGKSNVLEIDGGLIVQAIPISHSVTCFGYVVQLPDRVKLDGKKAAELGAKGHDFALLKEGKELKINNTLVKGKD